MIATQATGTARSTYSVGSAAFRTLTDHSQTHATAGRGLSSTLVKSCSGLSRATKLRVILICCEVLGALRDGSLALLMSICAGLEASISTPPTSITLVPRGRF